MLLNLPSGLGTPGQQDVGFGSLSPQLTETGLRQAIANGGLREDSYLPSQGLPVTVGGDTNVLRASTSQPAAQLTSTTPNKVGNKSVNIAGILDQMGKKYNVDPRLIYSTIMTESSGHPTSFRAEPELGTASYGLGQLLYTTAKGMGYNGSPEGLYDPSTNLDLTAHYIANAIKSGAKTPQQVATYYNSGRVNGQAVPGHVNRFMQNYQAYKPGMEVDINE